MAAGSFYQSWGFTDNPFSAKPLRADAIGARLLVGRDSELHRVKFRLSAGGAAVCLDGPVGVGKTSLANVAAFQVQDEYCADPQKCPLLLPCRTTFQISKEESPEDLRFRILLEVAQTLIEKAPSFRSRGSLNGMGALSAWLNNPVVGQLELQIAGFGGGRAVQPNESSGFTTSGFVRQVTEWLAAVFPDDDTGGVICVIDNLELLETSAAARQTIESLRDTLFTIRGLRWILCGAHGIIHSVVMSPRLIGHLGEPLPVPRLRLMQAQQVFDARLEAFKDHMRPAQYLPLTRDDFHKLYLIVGENLRHALATAHTYCMHVAESGIRPASDSEKSDRFGAWLLAQARATRDAAKGHIGPTALKLLRDSIKQVRGEFSPSDFSLFGFNSLQGMRPHVKALEDVGLVEATRDDSDQRRRTITVTGKGWLVDWAEATH